MPEPYLQWLLDSTDLKPSLKRVIERHLGVDQAEDDTAPDPTTAAVVLPLIVWQWQEFMLAEFGDSPFHREVFEAGLAKLKALCSEVTSKPWLAEGNAQSAEQKQTACPHCKSADRPRHRWQVTAGGGRVIRRECSACGRFIQFARQEQAAVAEANRTEPHCGGGAA